MGFSLCNSPAARDAPSIFTRISVPHPGLPRAASVFLMLEELLRSGRAKKGQNILCVVPESARFNAVFLMLEVM